MQKTRPAKRPDGNEALRSLLAEATRAWADEFDGTAAELDVSGADLVDWFADWRERAKAELARQARNVRRRARAAEAREDLCRLHEDEASERRGLAMMVGRLRDL